jgi:hypothetical protein
VAGLNGNGRQAAHEGAANAQDVKVHERVGPPKRAAH